MGVEEKGWSMFEWRAPEGENQLLAVYQVVPHTILRIDPVTGDAAMVSNESSQLVADLALLWGQKIDKIHGGSGVVLVEEGSPQPFYLAVLHFWYLETNKEETMLIRNDVQYAYKFRTEPPFDILSIAKKPLPLKVDGTQDYWPAAKNYLGGENYVSSMNYDNGDVVVAYGQADRIARIYRQPLADFEKEFFEK